MSRVVSRLLPVFLIFLMVLPGTLMLDPPISAGKGKKIKTITRTFSNTGALTISTFGSASPFPSRLQVAGFKNARITDVDLVLIGFDHRVSQDVDVLLVAPNRRNALVMSDVGNVDGAMNLRLRLDDEAPAPLAVSPQPLVSGTFRPTDYDDFMGGDAFDTASAPALSGTTVLSVFDGLNPNGEWQLLVRDDVASYGGTISGGWELTITAKSPVKKKNRK
jgi:subtilisin-like proprotein convertase family protein